MYFYANSNKMFFFFMLFFSTLISISSNSWLGCWMGLEINLLSFIPLISNTKNLLNTEAALKYFLTQSIASINFLFSIILKMILFKNFEMNNFLSIMINSSLLMKMGSAPFYFWFPNIMEGLSWMNCFILMTWQKISPMILLSYYMNNNFIMLIMMLNAMIGAISGFNQTSIRKLMAFSSINNLGWLMASMMISENMWLMYFLLYSFLNLILCFSFSMLNIFYINQILNFNLMTIIKMSLMINFFSLGGLPPFLGFFPKWIIINFLMNSNMYMLCFIFIMSSLIMLFFYIRMIYLSFLLNFFKLKWFKIKIKNNFFSIINFFSLISMTGLIMNSFMFF
ncbi:NADH dehydrogenase subunit 2 (mitochondrion) [Pieris rapae]|uniref:NADH-ubiquinone oxidoreductase chain 2 n=1 Tax=Pieris rapae TaxID=64459 RepID=G0WKM2_PIERA|nr:NADH dehydrogenase subunit 2 [Pieris rapae]ACT88808.1 NADH dehydrogenase subunit 2 [Pieris rapae]ADG95348.1 NADH dehydrogenase subunit 2 [Pieris rapae]UXX44644.1 NADH dehydrogenase subunit 2 [Pieris rapae]UXX44670.1 NADH dehydrogenase subunit 2 [Pieris rapae]UXX44683.1 NADH dehydrogenase subunit 2 [Pieris rapae]